MASCDVSQDSVFDSDILTANSEAMFTDNC